MPRKGIVVGAIVAVGAMGGVVGATRGGAGADADAKASAKASADVHANADASASASATADAGTGTGNGTGTRRVRVIVGGDLLPHRPSLVSPAAIRGALEPLGEVFGKADAVIANYEAATGDMDPKASRLVYAVPRGWLEELPKAGINGVTIANNHACDLGEAGIRATLEGAKEGGLVALGGDDVDPWDARVVAEEGGKRVCAVAWTTLSNTEGACAKSKHLAVAALNVSGKQRIDRAFAKARSHCDATIAILHGGVEYVPQTSMVMDQAAHAAEAGAEAVVIHHPHVASPVVIHGTKDRRSVPIFASVGNLVTNQGESWKPPMFPVLTSNRRLVCVNGWTRLGVLADLSFSFEDASGGARPRLDWGMHLVWIDNEHADDRSVTNPKIAARLLDPERDRAVIKHLSEDRRGPVGLFSEPCWFERESVSNDARPTDARCSSATAAPDAAKIARTSRVRKPAAR